MKSIMLSMICLLMAGKVQAVPVPVFEQLAPKPVFNVIVPQPKFKTLAAGHWETKCNGQSCQKIWVQDTVKDQPSIKKINRRRWFR